MKKTELKQILNEVLDERSIKKMRFLVKDGRRKLEVIKEMLRKEGYDV